MTKPSVIPSSLALVGGEYLSWGCRHQNVGRFVADAYDAFVKHLSTNVTMFCKLCIIFVAQTVLIIETLIYVNYYIYLYTYILNGILTHLTLVHFNAALIEL